MKLDLQRLLAGVATDSFDDGIRIYTELEPLAGPGASVKPAVYEGGKYQEDRRWASPEDSEPTPVIVIDNVPSQANRLEAALRQHREASAPVPEFLLDLSELSNLPAHLPRKLSSLEFPHRNADAYLRDARMGDVDFIRTGLGQAIFGATVQKCGPLIAWFPQALLYGFWQSHLGKKRQNTKHARAWVSEIVGWQPAATETRTFGLKGDALNLSVDADISFDERDQLEWQSGEGKRKLSEIGHGQVPFMGAEATAAAVSFARVTQKATVSFAQLRRVSLGRDHSGVQDTSARALLVALGLHAHVLAFGRAFALRSGADLRPKAIEAEWLGAGGDEGVDLGGPETTGALLREAIEHARATGVPLDGWTAPSIVLKPKENLRKAIRTTWPDLDE